MTANIIRKHEGSIRVRSKETGTVFSLFLPYRGAEGKQQAFRMPPKQTCSRDGTGGVVRTIHCKTLRDNPSPFYRTRGDPKSTLIASILRILAAR